MIGADMSAHPMKCYACETGKYAETLVDFPIDLPEGDKLILPKLSILRCEACGDEIVPPDSSKRISSAIDERQETLSPEEVQEFLNKFQLDQSEAAEALGLGAKTFHRWVQGTYRVSRSMGFFLRALRAHPEVFDWIRNRAWRANPNNPSGGYWSAPMSVRFPSTASNRIAPYLKRQGFNAAKGLLEAANR